MHTLSNSGKSMIDALDTGLANGRSPGADSPSDVGARLGEAGPTDHARKSMNERSAAVRLEGVSKNYRLGDTTVAALRSVDLSISPASFTVIQGPSGSGKSTLLNMIGCLDVPTAGSIEIGGRRIEQMSEAERTRFRADQVGFVFQNFNLIPVLSVLENVEYPLRLCISSKLERRRRANEVLESVGLGAMVDRRPTELSGGQRQRVAVARALVKQPILVLADEPTANLDQRTGFELITLMRRMQKTSGTTFVFSSHDPQLISDADVRVQIVDGRVVGVSQHNAASLAGREA